MLRFGINMLIQIMNKDSSLSCSIKPRTIRPIGLAIDGVHCATVYRPMFAWFSRLLTFPKYSLLIPNPSVQMKRCFGSTALRKNRSISHKTFSGRFANEYVATTAFQLYGIHVFVWLSYINSSFVIRSRVTGQHRMTDKSFIGSYSS